MTNDERAEIRSGLRAIREEMAKANELLAKLVEELKAHRPQPINVVHTKREPPPFDPPPTRTMVAGLGGGLYEAKR